MNPLRNRPSAPDAPENPRLPLTRRNYLVLLVGVGVILLGMLLMAGGGGTSPDRFDDSLFSWRRITLAPILVVGGFAVEIYGLMKRFR